MMWLFAALIVLAMGGVAMLGAGHGAPLAEVERSRSAPELPGDRPLRAEDLRQARFSLVFRGYRMSEVDALLHRLAAEKEVTEASQSLTRNSPQTSAPSESDPPA